MDGHQGLSWTGAATKIDSNGTVWLAESAFRQYGGDRWLLAHTWNQWLWLDREISGSSFCFLLCFFLVFFFLFIGFKNVLFMSWWFFSFFFLAFLAWNWFSSIEILLCFFLVLLIFWFFWIFFCRSDFFGVFQGWFFARKRAGIFFFSRDKRNILSTWKVLLTTTRRERKRKIRQGGSTKRDGNREGVGLFCKHVFWLVFGRKLARAPIS